VERDRTLPAPDAAPDAGAADPARVSAAALTERFVRALRRLEDTGEPDDLTSLYANDAVAGNVLDPASHRGVDGVREFWRGYRRQFGRIQSTFRTVIGHDAAAALEWTSHGEVDGRPVEYRGVTVLELGDGTIRRSCAYYDPHSLGQQLVG
jgi:ketosteroid isomerase-like protein